MIQIHSERVRGSIRTMRWRAWYHDDRHRRHEAWALTERGARRKALRMATR